MPKHFPFFLKEISHSYPAKNMLPTQGASDV
jgi:hypothetical protein